MAKMYKRTGTCFHLPFTIFKIGYVMNPSAIPVAILDVSGIVKMIKNAGNDSSNDSHSISFTTPIIKLPTIINAGAVIADTPDNALTNGPKKAASINKIATVKVVSPERPPTATPDDDST